MGYGWLNIGSIVFGLLAWILPIVNLLKRDKSDNKKWVLSSLLSVSACAVALVLQIFYNNHLVEIEDWAALMDTSNAVALISAILLIITIALKFIGIVVYRGKI